MEGERRAAAWDVRGSGYERHQIRNPFFGVIEKQPCTNNYRPPSRHGMLKKHTSAYTCYLLVLTVSEVFSVSYDGRR